MQCRRGYGVGEKVVPDKVDTDLLRPLVRMRVHHADGPNSMWLPLFSEDSAGQVRRLLGRAGEVRMTLRRRSLAALLAVPALLVFGLTAFNAVFWTRGRPCRATDATRRPQRADPGAQRVTTIERCVRAADAAHGPITEIVVCDD